ncbi:MAG: uracil-DNA glycosylase family protein [Verrucomicrobiales bacterium]|nr:uracil-DNA glycosylase family protein [Verrucomicrobiales bacterium]
MPPSVDLKGALSLLEKVMIQRKSAGFDTVAISEEGMNRLQSLPITFMRAGRPASTPVQAAAPRATITEVKSPPAQPASTPAPAPVSKPASEPAPIPQAAPQVIENPYGDLAEKTELRGRVEVIHPAGKSVREKLNNLFRIAKRCDVCRGMGTLRDQLVFAAGNPEADIMYIGEAPGFEEEEQKKPFVGPAGQKLDQILKAMGLQREDVYISNILKYRPKIGDGRFQEKSERKPTPDELAASVKFVRSEIEVIRPKVIVVLGGTAAEGLLDMSGSVTSLRGRFYELDGIPVSVTYHPRHLLRVESEPDKEQARQEKRKVWEDALALMEKLGMPISEKQRGFFSK